MMKDKTMAIVSILQHENIRFAVREAIQLLGGIGSFVQKQDKVVIKPNLVFALPPFTGFTTDYPVVQAILQLCQNMKPAQMTIAEGSGGNNTDVAFRAGGYPELAKQFDANLIDLNEAPTSKVKVTDGYAVKTLHVPKIILDCDVLINCDWPIPSISNQHCIPIYRRINPCLDIVQIGRPIIQRTDLRISISRRKRGDF